MNRIAGRAMITLLLVMLLLACAPKAPAVPTAADGEVNASVETACLASGGVRRSGAASGGRRDPSASGGTKGRIRNR